MHKEFRGGGSKGVLGVGSKSQAPPETPMPILCVSPMACRVKQALSTWNPHTGHSGVQLQQNILHPLKNVFGIDLTYITLNITLKMFLEFIS